MAQRHVTHPSGAKAPGGRISTATGLLCLALAALLVFAIAPRLILMPDTFESTVDYEGRSSQLDSAKLALGEAQDVSAQRVVEVTEVDGDTAVITSTSTAKLPGGDSVTSNDFAIDRTDFTQAEADGDVVDQKGGMVLSRPRGSGKESFTVFDATTRTAQEVEYVETTTVAGRETHYFEGTTIAPVVEPGLLQRLRTSVGASTGGDGTTMPAETVTPFVAQLPGKTGDDLRAALAAAGPEVPLLYSSSNTTKVWIDASQGAPIRSGQDQTITVLAQLGDTAHPLLDLNRLELLATDASAQRTADTAAANETKINLVTQWVPLGLVVLGLLLLVLGMVRSRPRRETPEPKDTSVRDLVGAGGR